MSTRTFAVKGTAIGLALVLTGSLAPTALADQDENPSSTMIRPSVVAESSVAGSPTREFATAKKKPKPKPRKAKVVLGIHNYQPTQNAYQYLVNPGVFLPARINCDPVMTSTDEQMIAVRDTREGLPGLFTGCGSGADMVKYKSGPMGPIGPGVGQRDWTNYAPWVAPGTSSAVPTVAAYTAWLQRLKAIYGSKIEMFEVWNEVDLDNFYRGTPSDLVDLTFAAAAVFGRKKVTAPSWSPSAYSGALSASGAYVNGKYLTRKDFFKQYWTLLLKRAKQKKVPLPVSVINIHTYGSGNSVAAAAKNRMYKLKGFLGWLRPILGSDLRGLKVWDTEWNFRRIDPDLKPPYYGFVDSAKNAAIWEKSAAEAACLGVSRQYTYVWTEKQPDTSSFESGQLPMNPQSKYLNASFKKMMNRTVTCK